VRSVAVSTAILLFSVQSEASPGDADVLVDEAKSLASRGDMLGAAAKFLAAHDADPRPELLCNVAIAYHKARSELPRAHLFFNQCLTRASSLDPKFVDSVRATLAAVENQLRAGRFTPIDIVVDPPGSTVEVAEFLPEEAFVGARLLWLPFGTHSFRVHAEGYVEQTATLETRSNVQRSVRVELARTPTTLPAPSPVELPRVRPAPLVRSRPSRTFPVAATITSGALGVFAGGAYLLARHHASEATVLALHGSRDEFDAEEKSARRWQRVSWGLGLGGAVLAGVSTVLWVRYARHVAVVPARDAATVSLTGSF
jgi:hypothetical protein